MTSGCVFMLMMLLSGSARHIGIDCVSSLLSPYVLRSPDASTHTYCAAAEVRTSVRI